MNDRVIAVSEGVRRSIAHRRGAATQVLIHGIDVERAKASTVDRTEVREQLGVGSGDVLVGTVANLRPSKAYPVLLRATRLMLDRDLPIRVIAAGVGPEEGALRVLHDQLGLRDRFTFLGYQDDIPRLLAALDIFVLASDGEALSIALMEAEGAGLPIVATKAGGVPEIVEDGKEGILVPPGQVGPLADAIESLVRDRAKRSSLADASRSRGERHDIATAVSELERTYLELAAARPAPTVTA
jgi:glycosyltransferase involved in cell wall biosynthesis